MQKQPIPYKIYRCTTDCEHKLSKKYKPDETYIIPPDIQTTA